MAFLSRNSDRAAAPDAKAAAAEPRWDDVPSSGGRPGEPTDGSAKAPKAPQAPPVSLANVAAVFASDAPVNRTVAVERALAEFSATHAAAVMPSAGDVATAGPVALLTHAAPSPGAFVETALAVAGPPVAGPADVAPAAELAPVDELEPADVAPADALPESGRIDPEDLEGDDLLVGVAGMPRERLRVLLQSAAASYRSVLAELEEATSAPKSASPSFADIGQQVARILEDAQVAAEEMRRQGHEEIDTRRAEVDADLSRRESALEAREQALEARCAAAEEEAAATTARARDEAERLSSGARADVHERFSAILAVQDSLREQLTISADELRRKLAAVAPAD